MRDYNAKQLQALRSRAGAIDAAVRNWQAGSERLERMEAAAKRQPGGITDGDRDMLVRSTCAEDRHLFEILGDEFRQQTGKLLAAGEATDEQAE